MRAAKSESESGQRDSRLLRGVLLDAPCALSPVKAAPIPPPRCVGVQNRPDGRSLCDYSSADTPNEMRWRTTMH